MKVSFFIGAVLVTTVWTGSEASKPFHQGRTVQAGSFGLKPEAAQEHGETILLDANVLIASADIGHTHHERSRKFVDGLERFHTSPATQGAFLRFFTRPWKDAQRREQPPLMSCQRALEALKAITARPQHAFLPDALPFERVSMRSLSRHKQWTDAYLMAVARAAGLRLATFDLKLDNMDTASAPVIYRVP